MSTSIFEIIGPIMTGPSSSHTAGMARIGMMAHKLAGFTPNKILLTLSPTLRYTYAGHRTDAALVGGALGMKEDDPGLKTALEKAKDDGIDVSVEFFPFGKYHQNTAQIEMWGKDGQKSIVKGISIGGGSVIIDSLNGQDVLMEPDLEYGPTISEDLKPTSCRDVIEYCAKHSMDLAAFALEYESRRSGLSKDVIRSMMTRQLRVMKESVEAGTSGQNHLLYGLLDGKDSQRMLNAYRASDTISGGIVPLAVARAIGVMELNGSMGCVVAAPTAGSAGIVPSCVLTVQEAFDISQEQTVDALFAASVAGVIMSHRNISFSGSVGGCQGEIGISGALAAVAITYMFNKEPKTAFEAMALSIKNILGLVCDPIAGPVEVPCIKRNSIGVSNAFISADMAKAGICSFIPPDQVLDALLDVENRLPQELCSGCIGGLASTDLAKEVRSKLEKEAISRELS